jgi:cbb3-type cytochrome oxidase subunit 3
MLSLSELKESECDENNSRVSQKLDKVTSAVICVALVTAALLIAFLAACAWFLIKRARKRQARESTPEEQRVGDSTDSFDESEDEVYAKIRQNPPEAGDF